MQSKIKTLKELKQIVDKLKKQGKKIVFTNGCFDLLHVGHIRYLQKAKKLGDILIVAINSDDSVKKIKGKSRPIIPAEERSEVIAALECVDYVVIFHETLPNRVIETLKPDIHVKGGDYSVNELPEAKIVKSYGGKVIILDKIEGHSTSEIIRRIKAL
ncbi:D-glycero-beta-D-manno-heptose 1-phosphate adenylyltransferase [candidate division KSB1 bacterium]|nr:MAG: D-glycero-beta-D-manno-heptose 1-phosphate adenylyltransferase [candidate division KSB1 bacterium]